jgi:hypothetical protein
MNTKICCDGDCEQGRYCPYRGENMSEGNKQWFLGVMVGVVLTSLIAIGLSKIKENEPPMNMMPRDIIQAYNTGLKDALRTNPASWDLEQTCLNMWADRQPVREP